MSDRVVTCVYCGHEYPDGTPTSQDEKLTEHIKVCDKHPMRELEQQLAAAKAELAELKEYQSFCPEGGSKNIFSPINRTEKGHLACKDCGQEFFTTVIYADCIAEKLSKMKSTEQRAEQAEALIEELTVNRALNDFCKGCGEKLMENPRLLKDIEEARRHERATTVNEDQ